ncbi:AT-rich interactive domain-containing protein 2 isoform X2 [Anthonomus grandis grandis]|uniref:AT-rich interactive domain-containing protein 2 isoform X2 n=1 Tax=Anthonomus grandis grandis TaxID=2921223 RepID=UPI0021656542|nr:AT-rich interactive domain-containing protein 2 isoform X2 [Anthonomus grandis grandis]
MADILGKDPATYSREKEAFLRDLKHFHDTRGTPFRRCPTLGGREIDLFLLYTLVTQEGGWIKVNAKNDWTTFFPHFKLPAVCSNGCVALKQIYLRYLDRWEKVHFLGEDGDRGSDDDEENRHKRWSARALNSVPHSYLYSQHNVSDEKREQFHLDSNLYKASDYDRLALSLISPLPNEQDFAINVCTLLSNDNRHNLKLDKHPRIVTFLLAHAGIFNHSSLRQLFVHIYSDVRKKPIHNFWSDVLESDEFLDLTNENNFYTRKEDEKPCDTLIKDDTLKYALLDSSEKGGKRSESRESDIECELVEDSLKPPKYFRFKSDPSDRELFCLRRTLGTQDYVGQRVLQVATILRNLCFMEDNVSVLTKNSTFLRFLLLCSCSQWGTLRNLGLDMLGNIAADFDLNGQNDLLGTSLLKVISKNLQSDDRACCLSSVEVLNKLSQNERNEDVLIRSLESTVYKRVCSFLTIHDVMLLIYTLECLYSLSSLGERSCNFIGNIHGVIDTLVSLVTVEGKSYGPKACIGMKLVETIPPGSHLQSQTQQQTNNQTNNQQTSPQQGNSATATTSSMDSGNIVSSPPPPSVTPVKVMTTMSNTPIRNVTIAPQRLLSSPAKTDQTTTPLKTAVVATPTVTTTTPVVSASSVIPSMSPQMLIQQQHAHQQAIQENEQFALAWLRATYEPCTGSNKIDHQELYKHYISSCSKIGRRGVISPLHFPRCVRSVFGGTVGPNPMKPANPSDPQYYEGIKVRPQPLKLNIPPPSPTPKPVVAVPVTASSNSSNTTKSGSRRKQKVTPVPASISGAKPGTVVGTAPLTVEAEPGCDGNGGSFPSGPSSLSNNQHAPPMSPILKAQLSAPPKPREGSGSAAAAAVSSDPPNSQAISHPHLSHALLGSTASTSGTTTTTTAVLAKNETGTTQGGQNNSSSLIKSLLANKVNDACVPPVSMKAATTTTDCQNVAQVAARQKLLSQQNTANDSNQRNPSRLEALKMHRINGVRQLFAEKEINDPSVSSTTQFVSSIKGKKEPPQPPPPPLAPLSNNTKSKSVTLVNEDSDSLSSTSCLGAVGIVSSTEDNDNSLTSFEGLLNGMPIVEETLNDSSNSKDSVKTSSNEISIDKPLRLADLLEKKFDTKGPALLNGTLNKDLKLSSEKSDLLENHIEKALSRDNVDIKMEVEEVIKEEVIDIKEEVLDEEEVDSKQGIKRQATDEISGIEAKKAHLLTNVNGSTGSSELSSANGDDRPTTVSNAAAKLFADFAADILEDEDDDVIIQETTTPANQPQPVAEPAIQQQQQQQQLIVDNNQQMLLSQSRQMIVSQPTVHTSQSVVLSSGTQLKTTSGQTVIVQNAGMQPRQSVLIQPANSGQLLLSQGLQGQVQLVQSAQSGQYVIQTNSSQGYVVAQPQTAMVHGQPQTVLLTQQGQAVGSKTIIILQQQASGSASHHQKVMVTPQGQQVVVTQVPRPVAQASTVSCNNIQQTKTTRPTPSPSPALSTTSTSSSMSNGVKEKSEEPVKKVVRDVTSLYICEWDDCQINTKFKSANQVYLHACESHCPKGDEEVYCLWDRCDSLKRKRFSLMTHINDKHCNLEAMKHSLVRRKKIAQGLTVEPPPPSPSSHPGYAPDAALHAIKRHALEFVNPKELQDDNEGPVTKSIRLTASLILRNLVIYSNTSKRYLRSYESHLANIALSNVESSRTIAQILYDINDRSTHR